MKGMPFFPAAKETAKKEGYEPRSVLDRGRSLSPSTSTLSSPLEAFPVATLSQNPPLEPDMAMAGYWEGLNLLPEPGPSQDPTFLPWPDHQIFQPIEPEPEPAFSFELQPHPVPVLLPSPPVLDLLFDAADRIETGDLVTAREILARLNQQLFPAGKPLQRSAFYCKEALQTLISGLTLIPPPSPVDVLLKITALKAFSDLSPLPNFANLISTQAILDQTNGCDRVHVIDFDLSLGGQWSSLLLELSRRRSPYLRLTAFVHPSSHHPFELSLVRETLIQFAGEVNVPFEVNLLPAGSFDPAGLLSLSRGCVVAVNLPGHAVRAAGLGLARLVKQLAPRVVVCVDHDSGPGEGSFPRHVLHVLQSAAVLLESVDAAAGSTEAARKIERYLIQPRILGSVLGRSGPAQKLFSAAGMVPVRLSDVAEAQAGCLVSRSGVRGFHVERRQAELALSWQRGALASVSAWSCQ